MDSFSSTSGGFLQPGITSPTPSASTATPSHLPKPRAHPLRAGSTKETAVINHIDQALLTINRRHAKKFSSALEETHGSGTSGYESFKEVATDIDAIVDILWVSGTPSLEIPYLISLAGMVTSYLPEYPFSARPTFRLLRKLDTVFASLLLGEDVDTGAPLPGFEGRRNLISMTEKVRIKSIAETCRIAVVEARETQDAPIEELNDDDDDDADFESENEMADILGVEDYGDAPGRWEMEAARVYEKTIQLLGDELGKQGDLCNIDELDQQS
ncbi:hypothetical protein ASPZODRAFT_130017 [Penicilliopsis zonata CBS 506.65]|uniref:Uncharacterized protein n=1 Tax=Penicilliopsis zonata CBS 506.65 TaxID=1073090 RepID=A0A1L9SLF0_9EURO|nr:hypothetical protein ASPZODRAFT_130017 [Penicilliopsis zonata CBS 506.65]OJJ48092.1 hypothetical protein ASPZODRAFT_130017 [Penicilliopsis zonata CBS 506.65]